MQPVIALMTYIQVAILLIFARIMQEQYSDCDGASASHVIGSVVEILIGSDVGSLLLPLFITCVSNVIYWLESPLLNI